MTYPMATPVEAPAPRRNGPYGPVGLVVGSVAILLCAALICALFCLVWFGIVALFLGWHGALVRLANLDPTHGKDAGFATRLDIVVSVIAYSATSLSVMLAARFRGGQDWRKVIAWREWHPFRRTRFFWTVLAITLLYSLAANIFIEKLYPPSKNWVTTPTDGAWIALFVLLAALLAPIAEELVFRGWLYTSLRASFGYGVALLISSILFAVAHWEHTHLYALAVFPVGLALGVIRERYRSIASSMTFHALYNGFASVLLFFVK